MSNGNQVFAAPMLIWLHSIVIQYEDFKNPFPSLERYQDTYTMFNDDIQGTGAVNPRGSVSLHQGRHDSQAQLRTNLNGYPAAESDSLSPRRGSVAHEPSTGESLMLVSEYIFDAKVGLL